MVILLSVMMRLLLLSTVSWKGCRLANSSIRSLSQETLCLASLPLAMTMISIQTMMASCLFAIFSTAKMPMSWSFPMSSTILLRLLIWLPGLTSTATVFLKPVSAQPFHRCPGVLCRRWSAFRGQVSTPTAFWRMVARTSASALRQMFPATGWQIHSLMATAPTVRWKITTS